MILSRSPTTNSDSVWRTQTSRPAYSAGTEYQLPPVGVTHPRPESVVAGEVEQAGMEHRLTAVVVANPHGAGSVVQDLLRHPAQVMEGALVTGEEDRQRLAVLEVEVTRSRPAKGHDEALHLL